MAQWVEPPNEVRVGDIEVNQLGFPLLWNHAQSLLTKLTMRIYYCHALSGQNVLPDHIGQQCGFTGPGLADDIHVAATVRAPYAKHAAIVAEIDPRQVCDAIVIARLH